MNRENAKQTVAIKNNVRIYVDSPCRVAFVQTNRLSRTRGGLPDGRIIRVTVMMYENYCRSAGDTRACTRRACDTKTFPTE